MPEEQLPQSCGRAALGVRWAAASPDLADIPGQVLPHSFDLLIGVVGSGTPRLQHLGDALDVVALRPAERSHPGL